jgi:hypothetical protein
MQLSGASAEPVQKHLVGKKMDSRRFVPKIGEAPISANYNASMLKLKKTTF